MTDVEDQTTQESVSPDVSMPLGAMIRIRDIRGLPEEEVDNARQEEMSIAKEFGITGKSSYTKWEYPGHITTIVSNGGITLDFSDCDRVENVVVETTEVGLVTKSAHLYGPNQEDTIYWPNVREANFVGPFRVISLSSLTRILQFLWIPSEM